MINIMNLCVQVLPSWPLRLFEVLTRPCVWDSGTAALGSNGHLHILEYLVDVNMMNMTKVRVR